MSHHAMVEREQKKELERIEKERLRRLMVRGESALVILYSAKFSRFSLIRLEPRNLSSTKCFLRKLLHFGLLWILNQG